MTTTREIPARFWAMVGADGMCLVWQGALTHNGYPRFKYNGNTVMAHRFIYEATYGQIPVGLQIDHRCNNTRCVNIEHLEAVTPRENVLARPDNHGGKFSQNTLPHGTSPLWGQFVRPPRRATSMSSV